MCPVQLKIANFMKDNFQYHNVIQSKINFPAWNQTDPNTCKSLCSSLFVETHHLKIASDREIECLNMSQSVKLCQISLRAVSKSLLQLLLQMEKYFSEITFFLLTPTSVTLFPVFYLSSKSDALTYLAQKHFTVQNKFKISLWMSLQTF